MSHPASARLVLDEMFSPAIAAALRDLGQEVIAVAERGELLADFRLLGSGQRTVYLEELVVLVLAHRRAAQYP